MNLQIWWHTKQLDEKKVLLSIFCYFGYHLHGIFSKLFEYLGIPKAGNGNASNQATFFL